MKNINLQQPNNWNNILQKVLVTKALTGNYLIAYKILNNPDLGLYKLKIKYKFQLRKFNGEHNVMHAQSQIMKSPQIVLLFNILYLYYCTSKYQKSSIIS